MGTRHLTAVELNKEIKVAQYGQWDGNPCGQGNTIQKFILKYLQTPNLLTEFKDILKDYKFLTNEERDKIYDLNNWQSKYPQLSRDTGAEVLELIMENNISGVLVNQIAFAGDSLFCEYAYILDLDNEILEVYKGFNKQKLDKNERFKDATVEKDSDYEPIKLFKKIKFSEITNATMNLLEDEMGEEE